jgi:glycosyltransferase involved in cell wall biosynthesis
MTKGKISILVPDVSSLGTTRAYIIAQGLQKLGYQPKIFGFIFGEQMYPEPPYNLPIAYIGGSNLPNLIKTAFTFLKDIDGDILYVIKPQLASFGLALLKAWRSKKPIILDFDDWEMGRWGGDEWQYQGNAMLDFLSAQGELRQPQHPFYLRQMEKQLDRVNGITVSTKFLEYRYGGTYLPNAIDTEFFNPSLFNTQKYKQDCGLSDFQLLIFTGTAKPNQGIEDILMALQKLNNPQLKLVLVGGNPQYLSYRQELMEQWQPWVILTAPQAFQETVGIVSIADIVMIPATDDLTTVGRCPVELIEGMAMAKPIIATNVGEIPSIINDTGYLVPPHNPDKIAEQISWILDHEQEAINKGQLARQRCQENYSLKAIMPTLEQVINLASYSLQ